MSSTIGQVSRKRPLLTDLLRVALATACLLMVPLAGMQSTNEISWTLSDFVLAGALLAGAGAVHATLARRIVRARQRRILGLVLLGALLALWAELAVGIFH